MRRLLPFLVGAVVLLPALPAAGWHDDLGEISVSESGGLSERTRATLEELAPLVGGQLAYVHSGTIRLLAVTRGDTYVQRPPVGFGYPMAVSAVEAERMGPLLGAEVADALGRGEAVMSRRSADLRGARVGDMLTLEGWDGSVREVAIGAVVPDEEIEWSEILLGSDTARLLGFDRPSRAVIWDHDDLGVTSLVLRYLLPPGPIRVRIPGTGDGIGPDRPLPMVVVKERFGEFAFRPGPGDSIDIEQAWVDANIVDVEIPLLGPFRCHRGVVPYVRAAMAEVERQRLGWLIDTADFQAAGGCYNPRLMRGGDKGFAVSRHAWGIAVDINPSTNPYGGPVRMEPRIGDTFRRWGFAWGAGWPYPDGMHFEWAHQPEAEPVCSSYVLVRSDRSAVPWEVYARDGRCGSS